MKTFYLCKTDAYGQRTGTIEKITIKPSQVSTDRTGAQRYNGIYLYKNQIDALSAALS